jgi:hypothetical protein
MEKTKEENDQIYILNSIKNINIFINNNQYNKAFGLLIVVLERLDDNQKNEVIDYYSKKIMEDMDIWKKCK